MTVKELRKRLSQLPDDKEVRIGVTDIVDNSGYLICGYAPIEEVNYDGYYDKVFIEGTDDV